MASNTNKRKKVRATSKPDIAALEASVNAVAGRARGMWLGFLTLGTYLFIAVGSVTHRQLFLETPIKLPILNVDLPLIGFFAVAPLFFLVNHFYLLLTLLSLGRRIAEYNKRVEQEELTPEAEDALRRKLDSFVIVLALAGTEEERKGRTSVMLRLIGQLTVVVAPVILLLFMQLTFLPYHSDLVTWLHRLALIIDLAMLWVFWPAILSGVESLQVNRALEMPFVAALSALLILFSTFVATFPGEIVSRNKMADGEWIPVIRDVKRSKKDTPSRKMEAASIRELLFEGEVDRVSGKRDSLWSNTLVVSDQDLVSPKLLDEIEKPIEKRKMRPDKADRSFSVRGRNLEGAVLTLSDLRFGDFGGSNLRNADLRFSQLHGANFRFADLRNAKLERARLEGGNLRDTDLRDANFRRALLRGVDLGHADVRGADFCRANLQAADLKAAKLNDAVFQFADLEMAFLDRAQGIASANFHEAILRGVNFGNELEHDNFRGFETSDLRCSSISQDDLSAEALSGCWIRLACGGGRGAYMAFSIKRRIKNNRDSSNFHASVIARALLDTQNCSAAKYLNESIRAELNYIAETGSKRSVPIAPYFKNETLKRVERDKTKPHCKRRPLKR